MQKWDVAAAEDIVLPAELNSFSLLETAFEKAV
jgi:hypothetical protein